MKTVQNPATLSGAFKLLGWAPLVSIIFSVVIATLYMIMAKNAIFAGGNPLDILSGTSTVSIVNSIVGIAIQFMFFWGFKIAAEQTAGTPAGAAFSTLKTIFLIFTIIAAVYFVLMLCIPKPSLDVDSLYGDYLYGESGYYGSTASADCLDSLSTYGIVMGVISFLVIIFVIAALFIVKNKTAIAANTSNIEGLKKVALSTSLAVWMFWAFVGFIILILISGAAGAGKAVGFLTGVFVLGELVLGIIILVKWISGFFDASAEVLGKEVQLEEYE